MTGALDFLLYVLFIDGENVSKTHAVTSPRFGLPMPIYVNMVRDPVERVISWYYYVRAPWYFVERKRAFPDLPLPNPNWLRKVPIYTVKTGYRFSPPHPGCHRPHSPWTGIIKLSPPRESLISDIPAGEGKFDKHFYSVCASTADFLFNLFYQTEKLPFPRRNKLHFLELLIVS